MNVSEAEAAQLVGQPLVQRLRELTLALYRFGLAHAESRGIILADTKFEFGLTDTNEIILIDEALTPDSSRYWPRDQYAPGGPQPSFDKQYVRDYLEQIRWNKQPPVPSLPDEVVMRTRREICRGVPPPDREGTRLMPLKEQLEGLIDAMVSKGVRYTEAQREFEKKFIAHVLSRSDGNLGKAAEVLGIHRNTLTPQDDGIPAEAQRLKRSGRSNVRIARVVRRLDRPVPSY